MSTVTQTTPQSPLSQRTTITPNMAWTGPTIRELDANGDPKTLHVSADVRTGPTAFGGYLLGSVTVSSQDGDGYYHLTLSSADTAQYPIRLLYIDVIVDQDDGGDPAGEPVVAMSLVADVTPSTYTPAP